MSKADNDGNEASHRLIPALLVISSLGLIPIALSYGLRPAVSLPWLFGITAVGVNMPHVFRAMMGLYLAFAGFWVAGAMILRLRLPALWSFTIFMGGLAVGRLTSLIVDGVPHPLLSLYMGLELVLCLCGCWLLRSRRLPS